MAQQLALLHELPEIVTAAPAARRSSEPRGRTRMCRACQAKEARYGFRSEVSSYRVTRAAATAPDRPRALCFDCFRAEIGRRQATAARVARGWNSTQTNLPLADTLERLDRRRRRAQIAARRALGGEGG